MKILLDTHILLWALFDAKKLNKNEQIILEDNATEIFVSSISLWEISLKYALKKLDLEHGSPEDIPSFARQTGFDIIQMTETEASTHFKLPPLSHKDPFDRMLIWQAINRELCLMTHDKEYNAYTKWGLKLLNK